jgi:Ca2+-transporting ATPase
MPIASQFKDLASVENLDASAAIEALDTTADGLSSAQVDDRLKLYGLNTIQTLAKKSLVKAFFANFVHLMAWLLWVAGALAFLAGMPQLGIAVWMVNVINGCFSFWQEFQAGKATEALLSLLPLNAHVIRSGQELLVPAQQLVPGDIIVLAEGDAISADCRIVSASRLAVDESTLSGEARPVRKLAEALAANDFSGSNLLFAGTSVIAGTCRAVVCKTAMNTRFGKIARLTQSVSEQSSPLQNEMARVTRMISILATAIGTFFFLLAVLFAHVHPREGFIFAIGMVVAFIPEGMLPTISLSLALGVQQMAKRNALIKKLSAVETLGCTNVICSDKTGTITQNKMTVQRIWTDGAEYKLSGLGYSPLGEISKLEGTSVDDGNLRFEKEILEKVLTASSRCSNARLTPPKLNAEAGAWQILGDPTEAALLVAARKGGIGQEHQFFDVPRICEIPFDSIRKRMSTVYDHKGSRILYLKGAPAEVLSRCTVLEGAEGPRQMQENDRQIIMAVNDRYAREGLRVLAMAQRMLPIGCDLAPDSLEVELSFCGLVAMWDPPHDGVAEAVQKCHSAGIKIVMITGDYGLTAESIARKVGIVRDNCRVITGRELDTLDDGALEKFLHDNVIFARVTPEHKLRIVTAFQSLGLIVAVTGDGVNDAPALRKGDIGIAMGISGSDVARESADMILTDDNFASIVSAVELGRAVYANIRKFAIYVFNSNMAEAVPFVVTLFSLGAIPLPLTVMQVLSVDLGTDMVPASRSRYRGCRAWFNGLPSARFEQATA